MKQHYVDRLRRSTREGKLGWRESVLKDPEIEREFVVTHRETNCELKKLRDGRIELWLDKKASGSGQEVKQLWTEVSGEDLAAAVEPRGVPQPEVSRRAYTRDYVKSCTARIERGTGLDGVGFLVSSTGHIATWSGLTGDPGESTGIQLRGGKHGYTNQEGDEPASFEAKVVAKQGEVALLQIGESVSTPYLVTWPGAGVQIGDTVLGGFRWWNFLTGLEEHLVVGEGAMASLPAGGAEGGMISGERVRATRRLLESMAGSPVLHYPTNSVTGMLLPAADGDMRLLGASEIHRLLSQAGVSAKDAPGTWAISDNAESPFCNTYIERKADEELRYYLLGKQAEYILLSSPPKYGVGQLFKRFAFENVRFKVQPTSVRPYAKSRGQGLGVLRGIVDDVARNVGERRNLPRARDIDQVIGLFETYLTEQLPKYIEGNRLVIVLLDDVGSLLKNERATDLLLSTLGRVHRRRGMSSDRGRVRFALSGHIISDVQRGRLIDRGIMIELSLESFSWEHTREMMNLLANVDRPVQEEAARRVLDWSGGHPFLVNWAFSAIAGSPPMRLDDAAAVDELLGRVLSTQRDPRMLAFLDDLRRRIDVDPEATERFQAFCADRERQEPFGAADAALERLHNVGVVRKLGSKVTLSAEFFAEAMTRGLLGRR